jgi:hypothetical protein
MCVDIYIYILHQQNSSLEWIKEYMSWEKNYVSILCVWLNTNTNVLSLEIIHFLYQHEKINILDGLTWSSVQL